MLLHFPHKEPTMQGMQTSATHNTPQSQHNLGVTNGARPLTTVQMIHQHIRAMAENLNVLAYNVGAVADQIYGSNNEISKTPGVTPSGDYPLVEDLSRMEIAYQNLLAALARLDMAPK